MGELLKLRQEFPNGLVSYTYKMIGNKVSYKIMVVIDGNDYAVSRIMEDYENASTISNAKKELVYSLKLRIAQGMGKNKRPLV